MLKLSTADRATFDRMLAKAQALASGRVSRALMPRVAGGEVKRLATAGKASQTNPQGRPWPKTKDGRALSWPSRVTIRIAYVSGKVVASVEGPDYTAPQHSGWRRFRGMTPKELAAAERRVARAGKGKVPQFKRWGGRPRRIVPKKSIPKRWADPLVKALNAGWRSFMSVTSVRHAKK